MTHTYLHTLKKIQRSFINNIVSIRQSHHTAVDYFQATSRKNIGVYRHSFHCKMIEILRQCYPAASQYTDINHFQSYAKQYLQHHKPTHYAVDRLADSFPRFIKKIHYETRCPVFYDLLQFEKLVMQSHRSQESAHYPIQKIHALHEKAWFALSPMLHPSVRVLYSHYAVGDLWRALIKKNNAIPQLIYHDTPFIYCIYRHKQRVFFDVLNTDEWRLFLLLKSNHTINDCIKTIKNGGDRQASWNVITQLHDWLQKEIAIIPH